MFFKYCVEIVYPDNGHILETGSLDIKIQVGLNGFEFPSKLHQTIICVCLSTGMYVAVTIYIVTCILHQSVLSVHPSVRGAHLRAVL